MTKKLNKQSDGRVVSENLPGRRFPRKALKDETGGKAIGKRPLAPKSTVVNFAKRTGS
jgi:hypothetical protein